VERTGLLVLSVVCCFFGGLSLKGPEGLQGPAYVVNVVLAVLLMVLTYQDLRRRGWAPLAALMSLSYLLPLVGLVVYALASNRPIVERT
jgi:hypothetical protein